MVLQPTKTAMAFCDIDPGRWLDVPARVFSIVTKGLAEDTGEELTRLSQSEIFVVFTYLFIQSLGFSFEHFSQTFSFMGMDRRNFQKWSEPGVFCTF